MPLPRRLNRHPASSSAVLGIALALLAGCSPPPPPAPPPPDVEVVPVRQSDQPIRAEWIGTLDGFVNAEIRAQVSGYLLRQDYADGSAVRKGDLLFEIDSRPFRATFDQLKANFDKTELDLKRETELLRTAVASQEDYDNALQAQRAAKAALETARLNLDFTRITSPIDGIAGIAAGQIGDLVGPSTGALTTVSTIDPIKVYFSISEQSYLDLQRPEAGEPRFPDGLKLELILSNGTTYPLAGKIYAADRAVDAGTGTLRLAGTFPNPDGLLRPGQYARVRAVVRIARGALLVPQRAVSELQGGYQVATVDDDNHAHLRSVQLGDQVGPDWIVTGGLKPGERVIADGIQKVREGALVHPLSAAAR